MAKQKKNTKIETEKRKTNIHFQDMIKSKKKTTMTPATHTYKGQIDGDEEHDHQLNQINRNMCNGVRSTPRFHVYALTCSTYENKMLD